MSHCSKIAAALLSAVALTAPALAEAAHPPLPVPGIYVARSIITASTPNDPSAQCQPIGTETTGLFTYPGAARPGATFSSSIDTGIPSFPQSLLLISYPVTPGPAVTQWNGTFNATVPGGISFQQNFSISFTFVTTNTFMITQNLPAALSLNGLGSCNQSYLTTMMRTGR